VALVPEWPHTRLQSGVSKPKKFTDGMIRYAYFCSTGEPSSTTKALANVRWKAAMDEEYDALIKNKTWHLVPSDRSQNIIDCKWVYKVKRKADGSIDHYKARLVMTLIMRTLLVPWLSRLLSVWCFLLLSPWMEIASA
jgi:histone deacetylase 1/2